MIELKVEAYCHDCPDFEPDVTKNRDRYEGGYDPITMETAVIEVMTTTVRCQHAARCRAVKRYLEKQKGEKV